jgi:hypothetical protein
MTNTVFLVGVKFPKETLRISFRSQVLASLLEKQKQETDNQDTSTFGLNLNENNLAPIVSSDHIVINIAPPHLQIV